MAEHVLDPAADGGWDLRPLQFGPPRVVDATNPALCEWPSSNPYDEQSPWFAFALARHWPRTEPKAISCWLNPQTGSPSLPPLRQPQNSYKAWKHQRKRRLMEVACSVTGPRPRFLTVGLVPGYVELSASVEPDEAPPPGIVDSHAGGKWNSQCATGGNRRETRTLRPRVEPRLDLRCPGSAEDDRFFDSWPYAFTDVMYTCGPVYQNVTQCHLYFNGLAPGAKVACLIGRIEALEEIAVPFVSPSLEAGSQQLVCPVSLNPDEYLEVDWTGTARHFDPNGELLGYVAPQVSLRIARGENRVRFSCTCSDSASPRAEVNISLRGQPLADANKTGS